MSWPPKGWFTGKKIAYYIDGDKANYVSARRIINGTDGDAGQGNFR
ncbi:hypothetical protein [Sinorhizobium meliloti]|uniref:Uncharacterized protein n=1 Tax=Sinorhizobium meliloti (strain SM11) TaxID=707241 RepID=F7XH00_SINMM|nr:hypothetical protein [Sinorhizobium meliloti]AEH83826.1 hypothetical protein SM11_pD0994 [Sinorhizobium meliloti SM11]MQX44092.1 hypothetical protein [Sinorhizobium meliloti]